MTTPIDRSPTSVDTMFRIMDAADALRQEARDDDDDVLLARIREVYQQQGTPMEENVLQKAFHQVYGRYPMVVHAAPKDTGVCNLCGMQVSKDLSICLTCPPPSHRINEFHATLDRARLAHHAFWAFAGLFVAFVGLSIMTMVLSELWGWHVRTEATKQQEVVQAQRANDILQQIAEDSRALAVQERFDRAKAIEVQTLKQRVEIERMQDEVQNREVLR